MKSTGIAPLVWRVRQSCLCVHSSKEVDISLLAVMQPHIYTDTLRSTYSHTDNGKGVFQVRQDLSAKDGSW